MLQPVLAFLIEVVVTLVGGACLLRAYLRWRRLPLADPLGRFVLALSDWLVGPLARLVPAARRLDAASLIAAWLLKALQYAALMALVGATRWGVLPVVALLGVARLAASVATAVLVVAALASWLGERTLLGSTFARLAEPLLAPVRRAVPAVGGVDLSPLIVIVLLQVAAMVLGSLQAQLFGASVVAQVS